MLERRKPKERCYWVLAEKERASKFREEREALQTPLKVTSGLSRAFTCRDHRVGCLKPCCREWSQKLSDKQRSTQFISRERVLSYLPRLTVQGLFHRWAVSPCHGPPLVPVYLSLSARSWGYKGMGMCQILVIVDARQQGREWKGPLQPSVPLWHIRLSICQLSVAWSAVSVTLVDRELIVLRRQNLNTLIENLQAACNSFSITDLPWLD